MVGETLKGPGYLASVDDVYMFSPTLVMDVRYGFNRLAVGHTPDRSGVSPSMLGFSGTTESQLTGALTSWPYVSVAGLAPLGGETEDKLYGQSHSLMLNFAKQRGSHNLKFGADIRSYSNFQTIYGQDAGYFAFSTAYTQGPLDNSPASPGSIGQGLASMLLGIPTGGEIDRNADSAATSTYWAFFLQDNWRVSSKLTADLGLRWEYFGPTTERFNRSARGFDFNYVQPINGAAQAAYALQPDPSLPTDQFKLTGGLNYAGMNGQPRLLYDRTFNNFAPRVGFAYQVTKNTVARGGFGIYPIDIGVPWEGNTGSVVGLYPVGFSQITSLVPSLDNGQTYVATLGQPFPNGVLQPTGSALGPQTFLGKSISFQNTDTRTPYNMNWSFNIQRLMPGGFVLQVGYVGSKAIKLPIARNIDGLPDQYLSTSSVRDQTTINHLTANIPNPMAGLLAGTSLNGGTIPRAGLLAAYPEFAGITMWDYQGVSQFNSLQVQAERRLANGFTLMGAYTYSKMLQATSYLNAADPRPDRYLSPNDFTHMGRISSLYDFPFGHGRKYLATTNRFTDGIVGGWTLGAIWILTSGPPVMFSNPLLLPGMTAKNVPLPKNQRTLTRWFNTAAFDTNSADQLAYNDVTLSPYLGVRGDYETELDASLLKRFIVKERYAFELRGEFLNAPNHPTDFSPPNVSPTSPAFGRVTAMGSTGRVVQVMLKAEF